MKRVPWIVLAALVGLVAIAAASASGAGVPWEPGADEATEADHPPIRIHGDEQFQLPTSGVVSGSGTAEDPYIIEGWEIAPRRIHTGGVSSEVREAAEACRPSPLATLAFPLLDGGPELTLNGIEIAHTDAHVVIRDNRIQPTDDTPATTPWMTTGILLHDADNVRVEGNHVGDEDLHLFRGICARASADVEIVDNRVHDTVYHAIHVEDGTVATVADNDVRRSYGYNLFVGRGIGIRVEGTRATVQDNVVREQATAGIKVYESVGSRVSHNTLVDNGHRITSSFGGLDITQSPDTVARDNVIEGSGWYGVYIISSDDVQLHGNNIADSAQMGLQRTLGGDVDATMNWWGCPDGPTHAGHGGGPDCEPIVSDVVHHPYRTSPNPDAGAGG